MRNVQDLFMLFRKVNIIKIRLKKHLYAFLWLPCLDFWECFLRLVIWSKNPFISESKSLTLAYLNSVINVSYNHNGHLNRRQSLGFDATGQKAVGIHREIDSTVRFITVGQQLAYEPCNMTFETDYVHQNVFVCYKSKFFKLKA